MNAALVEKTFFDASIGETYDENCAAMSTALAIWINEQETKLSATDMVTLIRVGRALHRFELEKRWHDSWV